MATSTASDSQLPGIAPGGQLWDIGGSAYVVFTMPGTNPPVRLGWHVTNLEQLAALGGSAAITRKISKEQAQSEGFLHMGVRTSLVGFDKDPTEAFITEMERQAKVLPMLQDPQVRERAFAALLEGRQLDVADLADTDYWKSRTQGQRDWDTFVLQNGGLDSAAVRQRMDEGRVRVRNALVAAGMLNPSDGLVDYYTDRFVTGELNETQLADAIRRETDPEAPGASPFAGRELPDGAQVVTDGQNHWIRTEDGKDYLLTGPGQVARFGDDAQRVAPGGQLFTANGQFYLRTGDGRWWQATGPGQVAEAQRLYGPAQEVPPEHIGQVAGAMIDLFRAQVPGSRMEDFAGAGSPAGEAKDLFAAQPEEATALGYEDRVRQMVSRWLGPYFGRQYLDDPSFINHWAGQFRQNEQVADQMLNDMLRAAFQGQFPQYEGQDVTYQDIAGVTKGQVARFYGSMDIPEDEEWWLKTLQITDAQERVAYLRQTGLERSWQPVVNEFVSEASRGMGGGQARRPHGV
jgi:hypothetical protein